MEKHHIENDIEESESMDLKEVDSIIEKIKELPENRRIDPNYFRNVDVKRTVSGKEIDAFPLNMIKGDLEDVEEKRKWILSQKEELTEEQKNANMIAEFVEVAVPEAIRKLNWLGEKIKVIRPSLYDDYFNGIDNIVQMSPEEIIEDENALKCVGFSIDFTINEEKAKEKIIDAMLDIVRGEVPSIKYFSADIMTKHGSKNVKIRDFEIPRIVMSCPHKILKESQGDLLDFEKNPDSDDAKENAENTVLRYYFIRESLKQLEFFADLAEKVGNTKAGEVYSSSLESFSKLIDELGIDEKLLNKKVGKISGPVGEFDLDANNGQFVEILKVMAQNKKRLF